MRLLNFICCLSILFFSSLLFFLGDQSTLFASKVILIFSLIGGMIYLASLQMLCFRFILSLLYTISMELNMLLNIDYYSSLYSQSTLLLALWVILGFGAFFRFLSRPPRIRQASYVLKYSTCSFFVKITLFFSFVAILLQIYFVGFQNRFSYLQLGASSPIPLLISLLSDFCAPGVVVALICRELRGSVFFSFCLVAFVALSLVSFRISYSRGAFFMVVLPIVFYFLASPSVKWFRDEFGLILISLSRDTLRAIRMIWPATICLFIMILSGGFMRIARGNFSDMSTSLGVIILNVFGLYGNFGILGYTAPLMKLINIFPSKVPFLLGQSYYRLLLIPIPRFIYDKPESTQRITGHLLRPDVANMTIPPGISGDAYINFGISGVLVACVFSLIFYKIDRNITIKRYLIFLCSPYFLLHLLRGALSDPLIDLFCMYVSITFFMYMNSSSDRVKFKVSY